MNQIRRAVTFLIAEDDDDDYFFLGKIFSDLCLSQEIIRFHNGKELIDFLNDEKTRMRRFIILLDINMPIMDGREALQHIKTNPKTKKLVTIVLTTSQATEDCRKCYELGANSLIQKPTKQADFSNTISVLHQYWTKIADLPD